MNGSGKRRRAVIATVIAAVVAAAIATVSSPSQANAPAGRYTTTATTVFDTRTKLTWQRTAPTTALAWLDARNTCAALGTTLGGTGWRLPSFRELMTLIDFSQPTTMIDSVAFPGTPSVYFWSLTVVTTGHWMVDFAQTNDLLFMGVGQVTANVRCVR